MPPIPATYIWADYFSLWICGEKTWWLSFNHIDGMYSMIASRDCISPIEKDLAIANLQPAMNRETFMRAKAKLCKTDEGRAAFSRVESMLEECGYDEFYWDVVWRCGHLPIQTVLAKADDLRAKIVALRRRSLDAV